MRTEELPERFLENMKRMLGTEYPDYINSMKENTRTAFRVNTNKITPEQFMDICPFQTEPVPWNEKGFYYNKETNNCETKYKISNCSIANIERIK